MSDIVQFIGTALIFYGVWQVRTVRLRAPATLIIAEAFMLAAGVLTGTWCLIAIGTVLCVVNVRTFCAWRKDGRPW